MNCLGDLSKFFPFINIFYNSSFGLLDSKYMFLFSMITSQQLLKSKFLGIKSLFYRLPVPNDRLLL